MPDKETIKRAEQDRKQGKSPSTQAGEFVREEMHHIREGKHGAASPEQAIAIGLSKARRAGVPLKAPEPGTTSKETREHAMHDVEAGEHPHKPSVTRSRATRAALKRKPRAAASSKALGQHAHKAATRHTASERSEAARKAVRTKGPAKRSAAARKAARTRARHSR